MWWAFLAELSTASPDPMLRERTQAAISPVVEAWAVLGGGVVVHGPMHYWRALTHAAEGNWDGAITDFRAACRAADRLRARPWSIEARVGLADAELMRRASGDVEEAAELLGAVEQEAGEIGMQAVLQRVAKLRARGVIKGNVFHCDGDVWRLSFAGRTVLVPDAKGMQDVHTLLSRPRLDVPVSQLIDPASAERVRSPGVLLLDEQAKTEYRSRLAALESASEAALATGDEARTQVLESERKALLAELRRATRLGGRSRAFSDNAERARKTVGARIRDTLRHLQERHPELANHLRASVSTGSTCRYQPVEEVAWIL
jgi:hypothetical protein